MGEGELGRAVLISYRISPRQTAVHTGHLCAAHALRLELSIPITTLRFSPSTTRPPPAHSDRETRKRGIQVRRERPRSSVVRSYVFCASMYACICFPHHVRCVVFRYSRRRSFAEKKHFAGEYFILKAFTRTSSVPPVPKNKLLIRNCV